MVCFKGEESRVAGRAHLVAPQFLGSIHCPVGSGDQSIALFGVERIGGNPHRTGESHTATCAKGLRCYRGTHAFGRSQCSPGIRLWQDDHEFLAPPTSQGIHAAQGSTYGAREFAQDRVSHRMAITIVDRLEVIQVQEEQGAGTVVALGALEFLLDGSDQGAMVGQAGERVGR